MADPGAQGANAFARSKKVSAELFSLTYGAMVLQLLTDYEDAGKVNAKLHDIGASMGARLVDELLSKSGTRRCGGFKGACQTIAAVGFKMYWGQVPKLTSWNDEGTACSLVFTSEMPIEEFVQLPSEYAELQYTRIVCGVIQGGLEAVSMKTKVRIVKDRLRGDEATEIRIELLEIVKEVAGDDYRVE
jgi:hypothetical protein